MKTDLRKLRAALLDVQDGADGMETLRNVMDAYDRIRGTRQPYHSLVADMVRLVKDTVDVPSRPPVRYFGGKFKIGAWVASHFPDHRCYVEPFLGAAGVMMKKPMSPVEVGNDLNTRIVNVFRVLRDPEKSDALARLLRDTPYSLAEYEACRDPAEDPVEDARRCIVVGMQAHGSSMVGGGKLSGWRRGFRPRGPSNGDEWSMVWTHVDSWSDRMRRVCLESAPAVDCVSRWDSPDTLFYVDPPYVKSTRYESGRDGYLFEMNDVDHRELARALGEVKGMVILSGYHSDLYAGLYAGWERIERPVMNAARGSAVEVLWFKNCKPRNEDEPSQ